MTQIPSLRKLILITLLLILTSGCDEEVAEVAREAADRQAAQNLAMADLQKDVAAGSRRLVEADAVARREMASAHHELQSERNELEAERQTIAHERRTASMLVAVARAVGGLLLVGALVGFCAVALLGLGDPQLADADLNELLVGEITSDDPLLVPPHGGNPLLPHNHHDQTLPSDL